jgi:uncharacterized protein (DUF1800 family)
VLEVTGSRFVPGATVLLDGAPLATDFVDGGHLRAAGVLAADRLGSLGLRVESPGAVASAPYGGLVAVAAAGGPDPETLAAVRFLEQASFGPTATEVERVKSIGIDAWLGEQLALPETPIPDATGVSQVQSALVRRLAAAPDQLRQRMVFALSQLLVVSSGKNNSADELLPWARLLSRNAFGSFRNLLREVTLSPSMGKYLDLANSSAPSGANPAGANENYARELLQLFAIGLDKLDPEGQVLRDAQGEPLPTYDQSVVRNLALALTGWTYPTVPGAVARVRNPQWFEGELEARLRSHDRSAKVLFDGVALDPGQTPEDELEAALDAVYGHPNVAPFIATRLIRALVTSNPSPDYIGRVAAAFLASDGNLGATAVAILTDDDARDDDPAPEQGHLRDPLGHLLALTRALGFPVNDPGLFLYYLELLGQRPLGSPTVFNFYSPLTTLPGRPDLFAPESQIYSPALAVQRASFLYRVLNGEMGTALPVDLAPFVALAADPAALVDAVNARLYFGRMSGELRQTLIAAAQAAPNPQSRAIGAVWLAAIASEYAVVR